jgi:hypothetical protein
MRNEARRVQEEAEWEAAAATQRPQQKIQEAAASAAKWAPAAEEGLEVVAISSHMLEVAQLEQLRVPVMC